MAKTKKLGRPPGPYNGAYLPPHIKKQHLSIRLPAWMHKLLRAKDVNVSKYVEKLILHDTGWKEPKK